MLSWMGIDRSFVSNPVTFGALALVVIAAASAARSHQNFTNTCVTASPVVVNVTIIDTYFVGRFENIAYEHCGGRIPDNYSKRWPLSDCRPGGRAMWSDGTLAGFPQVCRAQRGNVGML